MHTHNNHSKPLKKVLKKMCSMVKVKYHLINFNEYNWFLKHSWSEKTQQKFKDWMVDYIYKDKEALKAFMPNYSFKNKKLIRQMVENWLWHYGWALFPGEVQ